MDDAQDAKRFRFLMKRRMVTVGTGYHEIHWRSGACLSMDDVLQWIDYDIQQQQEKDSYNEFIRKQIEEST